MFHHLFSSYLLWQTCHLSPLLPFCPRHLQCQQHSLPTFSFHSNHKTCKVILRLAAPLASLPSLLSSQGLTDVSSKHLLLLTFPSFPSSPHLTFFPYRTFSLFAIDKCPCGIPHLSSPTKACVSGPILAGCSKPEQELWPSAAAVVSWLLAVLEQPLSLKQEGCREQLKSINHPDTPGMPSDSNKGSCW